jgi:hypothetical protein
LEQQQSRQNLSQNSTAWIKDNQDTLLKLAVEAVRYTHRVHALPITEEEVQNAALQSLNDMQERFEGKRINTSGLKATFLHILRVRGQLNFTAIGLERLYSSWIVNVEQNLSHDPRLAAAITGRLNYIHSLLKASISSAQIEYEAELLHAERLSNGQSSHRIN